MCGSSLRTCVISGMKLISVICNLTTVNSASSQSYSNFTEETLSPTLLPGSFAGGMAGKWPGSRTKLVSYFILGPHYLIQAWSCNSIQASSNHTQGFYYDFWGKKVLILKLHLGESTQSFCMLHSSMWNLTDPG